MPTREGKPLTLIGPTPIEPPPTQIRLGYILFVKGKKSLSYGAAAREFYFDDPKQHPTRHAFLPIKTNTRFNVYYKYKRQWIAVSQNFQTLAQTMPYLQTSERVLVEYQ